MRIAFRETRRFSEMLSQIATDDEYQALQNELEANPEKGDVIQGAGGARKVRMGIRGQGKSGGARVIYYVRVSKDVIFLLDIYTKREKADLTKKEKESLSEVIQALKGER
jgi:hypothetical protein